MKGEVRQQQQRKQIKQDQQQYDSFLYKFQQQIVDAWKPIPHTRCISIILGLTLIQTSSSTQQIYIRYDNICTPSKNNIDNTINSPCRITFTLTQILKPPIYIYYGFKGFYQNHRRYIKYYSNNQLISGDPYVNSGKNDCGQLYTNFQTFGNNIPSIAGNGTILINNQPAFPCGTISRMYYQLRDQIQGFKIYGPNGSNIPYTQSGIAWPSDIGMHTNAPDHKMAFRVTQQTWLVWFRPAAQSNFYKLNGIINQDLYPGVYTVGIKNQVIPTWGQKWFSLSKSTYQGNRDNFLGISFLILGGVCIVLLIIFLVRYVLQKKQQSHQN